MDSWPEVCYLCGQGASANDHISLYPLPRARSIREKWMRILELRPNDRLSLVRVCSRHFQRADFRRQRLVAGDAPLRLLPYAVPRRRAHPPHRQAGSILHVLDHLRQLTSNLEDAMSSSSDASYYDVPRVERNVARNFFAYQHQAYITNEHRPPVSEISYHSLAVTECSSSYYSGPSLFAFQIDDVAAYVPPRHALPMPPPPAVQEQDQPLDPLLEPCQVPDSSCIIDLTIPESKE